MSLTKILGTAAGALLLAVTSANATIVNLSANPISPNAGNSSPGYTYNPITLNLAPGTYTATVVGIAGGGIYDAYSVYAPTASNLAYTDGNWSVSVNGVAQTVASTVRYNTTAEALAHYSTLPLTFTIANVGQSASFYVDDTALPFFADDSGGVSLSVTAVPEPISLTLFGTSVLGLAITRRFRRTKAAA